MDDVACPAHQRGEEKKNMERRCKKINSFFFLMMDMKILYTLMTSSSSGVNPIQVSFCETGNVCVIDDSNG